MKKIGHLITMLFAVVFLSQCAIEYREGVYRSTPPDYDYDEQPELIVIPGTYVYYADIDNYDIFFYSGFWWRPWNHGWYRASVYSGPWITVKSTEVPNPIFHLPSGWREKREASPIVRWNDARDHWKDWEKNKHWDKQGWKRENIDRVEVNRPQKEHHEITAPKEPENRRDSGGGREGKGHGDNQGRRH